jgi:hypothetical protein
MSGSPPVAADIGSSCDASDATSGSTEPTRRAAIAATPPDGSSSIEQPRDLSALPTALNENR